MSERELNTEYLKTKLENLCDNDTLEKIIPVLLDIISERYTAGYRQAKFDVSMKLYESLTRLIDEL